MIPSATQRVKRARTKRRRTKDEGRRTNTGIAALRRSSSVIRPMWYNPCDMQAVGSVDQRRPLQTKLLGRFLERRHDMPDQLVKRQPQSFGTLDNIRAVDRPRERFIL